MTAADVIALLGLLISWPVLAAVFLFLFRSQIATMLLGVRRVSREGVEIALPDQRGKTDEAKRLSETVVTPTTGAPVGPSGIGSVEAVGTPTVTTPRAAATSSGAADVAEQIARTVDSRFVDEQAQRIRQDLAGRHVTGEQAERWLARHLAASQIAYAFEALYSLLWGSQLSILQYLTTFAVPVPVEQVRSLYAAAAQQYPVTFASYPFENYLGFMKNTSLVQISSNAIAITPAGREFLAYLMRAGRPLAKPQ